MKNIFVLDTNVLLYDPNSIKNFNNSDIFLPLTVIKELDKFKKGLSSINQNFRTVSRFIDKLRELGNLSFGIIRNNLGDKLFVLNEFGLGIPKNLDNDEIILEFIKKLQELYKNSKITLVTKDLNLRIIANTIGIDVIDYNSDIDENENVELFPNSEIDLTDEEYNMLYKFGAVPYHSNKFFENQYLFLKYENEISDVVKYQDGVLKLLSNKNHNYIHHKNLEQKALIDALFDDSIKILFVIGLTGTGKTVLTLGSALEQYEKNKFEKIFMIRNTIPVGKDDLGFLPGDLNEKLFPWFMFVEDALENLMENGKELLYQNIIEIGALSFIRGRTFKNTFMIIEEAQNLFLQDLKSIISRAGEKSKVIVLGDPYQIDNPLLSDIDNGLVLAAEKLKKQKEVSVVYLKKCERSRIADLSNLL